MNYGFGVDLGGTTVKLGFFDQDGTLLSKWEIPTVTENGGKQILPDIAASIRAYLAEHSVAENALIGIGIGVPGPVNENGIVNGCINLGWGVCHIEEELQKLTGLSVKAGNDASVAALGECWKGGGMGCKNMVMATLGTGVGGGIVIDGKVIRGRNGAGGEIGHIVLNRNGTGNCNCGKNGCVETYCSATGIIRVAKMYLKACEADSCLRQIEDLTCKDIFDAGKAGDVAAREMLEKVYSYIGEFLADVCCVVDPEIVVIGGGVSRAGQMLIDGVRPYFEKYAYYACRDTKITLATLGNDAGIYGAFKLILGE